MPHIQRTIKNKSGFTFIELMIVISIIGILAITVIPNYIHFRNKAYCGAAENDARAIMGILSDYFSIPAHKSLNVPLNITANTSGNNPVFPINGIVFPLLTDHNTADIKGSNDEYIITVTDGSERCPSDYQTSDPQWDTNNRYTKTL